MMGDVQRFPCKMSKEKAGSVSDTSRVRQFTWEIDSSRDLFLRPGQICSPRFSFALNEWKMCINPYLELPSNDYTELSLQVMKNDGYSRVEYKLGIRNHDGTTYKSFCDVHDYNAVFATEVVHRFPRWDIMGSELKLFGPKGQLTMFCELRLKDDSIAEASTQTEDPFVEMENSKEASTQTERYFLSADKLVQDFAGLLRCNEGSDMTFVVREKEFKAHRFVLGARTPVFSSMFRHQMVENCTGVVTIEDCEPDAFEDFLYYVYTGKMRDRTLDRALCLHGLAEKYQLAELKADCSELMADLLSVETFCDVLTVAVRHSDTELTDLATDFFLQHKKEIVLTAEWEHFVVQSPVQANKLFIKMAMI